MADLHINDIGTLLRITIVDSDGVAVDISTATGLKIELKKPDGTTVEKTAALINTGSDGKLGYRTISGDLDQAGTWSIQAFVTTPSWSSHSAVDKFKVKENL